MGNSKNKIIDALAKRKKSNLLVVGLYSSGKRTITYKLNIGEPVMTIPIIGFKLETQKYKNLKITEWDFARQINFVRRTWDQYYKDADALIFVIDSSDIKRMDEAREELLKVLESPLMSNKPVLVYANKQDLKVMSADQVSEKLKLEELKCPWKVQGCCALTQEGVYEGLEWLYSQLPAES